MEVLALLAIIGLVIWSQKVIIIKYAFRQLHYECRFSVDRAYEGDTVQLVETVHNNKFMPLQWLKVEIHSSRWLDFANTNSTIAQDNRFVTSGFILNGFQKTKRSWKVKCLKRGVYCTENVTLVSGDFFGTITCSTAVRADIGLIVYPGMIDLDKMLIPVSRINGDIVVRRWIVDDPFIIAGTREYTPLDPMNKIHWQTTARHGALMVRKHDFTAKRSIRVILNIQSMEYEYYDTVHKDIVENGIRIAAALLNRALRHGWMAGFTTNGVTAESGEEIVYSRSASGPLHIRELMETLARLRLRKIKGFEEYLLDIGYKVDDSDVVIITPYLCSGLGKVFKMLQGKHIIVILMSDDIKKDSLIPGADYYIVPSDRLERK